jgi:hypothetical protein
MCCSLGAARVSAGVKPFRMSDEKHIAKLTSGESSLLLSSCAITGMLFGFLIYFSDAVSVGSPSHPSAIARWILGLYLVSLFAGPGTWFGIFGRFGIRGSERRTFMRGAWWMFNGLAWGLGIVVFALLYGCHMLWS